jgi:hypothetical protein
MAAFSGLAAPNASTSPANEIVEISLLLPASRVQDLMTLAERRGKSVAQVLRLLIDEALEPVNRSEALLNTFKERTETLPEDWRIGR